MIVLVTGLPGSGKSTLARLLARELGVALLSLDSIKEALVDAVGEFAAALAALDAEVREVVGLRDPEPSRIEQMFES
jgi:predicted kinase